MREYLFNQRARGIFFHGFADRNGLPVGDVFAHLLRASLFLWHGKEWPNEKLGTLIRCYSSDQLARLSDDACVGRWADQIGALPEGPPAGTSERFSELPEATRAGLRRAFAEAMLIPELQADQAMSVLLGDASGFILRRDSGLSSGWHAAEEWRDGAIVHNGSFDGPDAQMLAYGWILNNQQEHLAWRCTNGALQVEFTESVPTRAAGEDAHHAVVTAENVGDIWFLQDLASALQNRIVHRLTIVAGAEAGWALPYPKRDVIFQDLTREFWEAPSGAAMQAAARIRPDKVKARAWCRTEFPNIGAELEFDPAALGFPVDTSWHNDEVASFETQDGLYRLWVAERDADDRENPENERFAICRNNPGGTVNDEAPLFTCEELVDLQAYITKTDFKALQARGRSLSAPRG